MTSRIVREYRELSRLPEEGVAVAPLEHDVRTWIVNLAPPASSAIDFVIHCEIDFPLAFPSAPPAVYLLQRLPNAHVLSKATHCCSSSEFGAKARQRWAVCLDMLAADGGALKAGHRLSYRGWSSAFTLRSVLVQLRSTLFDERLTFETEAKGTVADARAAALALVCETTGHMASMPVPPLPTAALLAEARRRAAERRIVAKAPVVVRAAGVTRAAARRAGAGAVPLAQKPRFFEQAAHARTVEVQPTVQPKTEAKTQARARAGAGAGGSRRASANAFAHLDDNERPLRCSACGVLRLSTAFSRSQRERDATSRSCKPCQAHVAAVKMSVAPGAALTKSQLRNARRAKRKRELALAAAAPSEVLAGKAGKAVAQATAPAPAAASPAPASVVDLPTWVAAVPPTFGRQASDGTRALFTCAVEDVRPHEVPRIAAMRAECEAHEVALAAHAGGGAAGRRARVKVLKKLKALKKSPCYQRALASAESAHERRAATVATGLAMAAANFGGGKLLGPLLRQGYDALVHASSWLSAVDIAPLAMASKGMATLASDGLLWRRLFAHRFPRAQLSASSLGEWKSLFKRELHSVHDDLVCFHTKRSIVADDDSFASESSSGACDASAFVVPPVARTTEHQRAFLRSFLPAAHTTELIDSEASEGLPPCVSVADAIALARKEDGATGGVILGAPVEATTNPRTRRYDNIRVFPAELLSYEASKTVRQTTWGERLDAWLPLYLDDAHYTRALEQGVLQNALHRLAKKGAGSRWSPLDALDVLPRIMNTHVVLLADGAEKGVVARAVASYCAVLRLFAALCRTYPVLQREVDRRLCTFARDPAARTKTACASLGEILPLLCVATPGATPTWSELAGAIVSEAMDRGILWAAKACGGWIANDTARLVEGAGVDRERLQVTRDANAISFRLIGFHVAFLHDVARPDGCAIGDFGERLDAMFGRPDVATIARAEGAIARVFGASTWPETFAAMRIKCPSPGELTDKLVRAVRRSREKGYHRHGMNFTKVHSSGVSRILMRGETYSAAPNLKRIKFVDEWRWNSSSEEIFLDASVLVFAHGPRALARGSGAGGAAAPLGLGELLGIVDYSHTVSSARVGRGAISHSGDVMDDSEQRGRHEITINLSKLSRSVGTLLFTLSSWAGKTLQDAKQPVTTFVDAEQSVSLCSYALDDRPRRELQSHSAAHMCALRRGPGGKSEHGGGWRVEAIGALGAGAADVYGPIERDARQRMSYGV